MINLLMNKIAQTRTASAQNPNKRGVINTATKPYANDCFVRSNKSKTEAKTSFGAHLRVPEHDARHLNKINKIVKIIEEKSANLSDELGLEFETEAAEVQKTELAGHFVDLAKTYLDLDPHNALCKQCAFNSAIEAVELAPQHAEANYLCGNLEGEPKDAFKYLTAAIKAKPDNAEYHVTRAIVAQEIGDKRTALSDLQKAISLEPKNPEHRVQKGFVHFGFKESEQAIQEFDTAISMNPNNYRAHAGKAYTLFEIKKYPEAAQSYEKALTLNPDPDELGVLHTNLGSSYYHSQNYPKAIKAYTLALETDTQPEIFFDRGMSHLYLGNYDEAIRDAQMAQKTGMHDLSPVSLQVVSMRQQNRHDEADKLLELAEDSYPELDFKEEVKSLQDLKIAYDAKKAGEQ